MGKPRRRALGSVRVRITAIATIAVAVVLVAAGALLLARQRAGLLDQLDDSLTIEAERLADAAENGELGSLADDRLIVVVDSAGGIVDSSLDPDDDGDDRDDIAALAAHGVGRQLVIDGEPHRVATETFDGDDGDGVVHVAASMDDVDASVAELRGSLLVSVPLAVAALLIVVWAVVGRTLRPVERMRSELAAIGMNELDRRLPTPTSADEIADLANTLNDMLARLERSVAQQQRFVADASHELRTPLTRMRAELEVDERDPRGADPAATRRSQLDELDGMQHLVDDLLLLARSDAGAALPRREPIDLDDLVFAEVAAAAGTAITVDATRVSAAQTAGNRDELRRVVRNLLDNARRHAVSAVSVELSELDGAARLVVADDGPGIAPDKRTAVFERFARLDEARSGTARAGLGLSIVADIVARHHGTVAVDEGPAGGARFVVTLPAS